MGLSPKPKRSWSRSRSPPQRGHRMVRPAQDRPSSHLWPPAAPGSSPPSIDPGRQANSEVESDNWETGLQSLRSALLPAAGQGVRPPCTPEELSTSPRAQRMVLLSRGFSAATSLLCRHSLTLAAACSPLNLEISDQTCNGLPLETVMEHCYIHLQTVADAIGTLKFEFNRPTSGYDLKVLTELVGQLEREPLDSFYTQLLGRGC